jgi:glycosyltransferase involved in cell wall biosynthesis
VDRRLSRVLFVAGGYYPEIGGGELLNARHAQLIRDAGYDVKVVVPRIPGVAAGVDAWGTPFEPTERWNLANFRLIPPSVVEREIETFEPSLIYFAGPHPHDVYALPIAHRRKLPCVALYHADFRSDRAFSRLATSFYAASTARYFEALCVTTHAYGQRLRERGVDAQRIAYVGMGVDVDFFVPSETRADASQAQLLFVGALDDNHTYKRLDLLLHAVKRLLDEGIACSLTIVGDGNARAAFEREAKALQLGDATKFRGKLDNESLRAAYQHADVLVLPSPTQAEGFGMVVLEALACGCPVVTSHAAGASEVVRESGIGALWDGLDIRDLSRAIRETIEAPSPRAEIAKRARSFALTHSWRAVGERLAAAIGSKVGEPAHA